MLDQTASGARPIFLMPGQQTLLRYRRLGPVSVALPVIVVDDGPAATMLYLRPGTQIKERTMPDGTPIPRSMTYWDRARLSHSVGDGMWTANHALIILRSGLAHDVRLLWSEHTWEFRGWYVNIQRPFARVPTGFDTADHVLDIVKRPDGEWLLKDEAELTEALSIGRFSDSEVQQIYAEATSVGVAIGSGNWPFDDSLLNWRPEPHWPIPSIPSDWNHD